MVANAQRVTELRALIVGFVAKRLEDRLDKISADDPKRTELEQQFVPANWLEDAARRVKQIQAVTHALKPIHPDAKGSSLYSPPRPQKDLTVVGSHCLGEDFATDVVGNAAALDVYKFLKLEHQGKSLLAHALAADADFKAALSDDETQAEEWIDAFAGLVQPRGQVSSHSLAKQLFWLTGNDPHDDRCFDLLAPLHASSLAHRIYEEVQADRFGEAAVAAREARKKGEYSSRPVREYPHLAIQKLGGTKPQNISQLNSERRGENLLLASLPPVWQQTGLKPLLGVDTMFRRYGQRSEVKQVIKSLFSFLKSDPRPNQKTRERRAAWVDELIDAFLQFSAELRALPAGWSQVAECHLSAAEQHWLDPDGVEQALAADGLPPPGDTAERVSALFANWLNAHLREVLPVGDPEYRVWRDRLLENIKADERENDHGL
jgi:CRISPR-associated protein Csy1